MPAYKIRGIDVDFPFAAYDCQLVYMEKVIQALQEGCNALLESPTGTGKTLCLLCATLAWRKSLGDFSGNSSDYDIFGPPGSQSSQNLKSGLPVIIYSSRTHSQLKQVIRELKTSSYRPKMVILGSREQLCVHDEIRLLRGKAQDRACHFICKKRACQHLNKVNEFMQKNTELGNEPLDIEDLVNIGRTKGPCPYYVSRELHKVVDILFVPYNYLIDPKNRLSLTGMRWKNSILIFDEAHNLEGICAEASSFDLPSSYLTACILEAKQCVDLCVKSRTIVKSDDKKRVPENYAILTALLQSLEERINEFEIKSSDSGCTYPGEYMFEFLSKLKITNETANLLIQTIDNAALLLEEGDIMENSLPHRTSAAVCRLESIRDILNIIFRNGSKSHAKYYYFHVQESRSKALDTLKEKVSRTLSWWCFHPGYAMEEFIKLGVRSIVLTSGTLSPLDSFALEFNLDFPIRLENPHVISPNQVWAGVVSSGPSGCFFNSSYRNRDSLGYKHELGNAIVNFARIVPDGLLVFFPSYYLMDQCIESWKNSTHMNSTNFNTIWERICKHKQPVIEPKQSSLFQHAIEDFEAKLCDGSTSGAIFFAVCRGKVSEGLDFADQSGRAVVITGLPFALQTDPKVRLKREYLDKQVAIQTKGAKVLTGEEWYVQQSARAVNQAVGRIIRHRHDYGAIIFCDERFTWQKRQSEMSFWLRPHVKCYPKFGEVVFNLTRFFRDQCSYPTIKKPSERSTEKIVLPNYKISSASIGCQNSNSERFSKQPSSSAIAVTGCDISDKFENFVPANQFKLMFKENSQYFSLWPGEKLHDLGILRHKESGEVSVDENSRIIDLTSESPLAGKSRCSNSIVPCSSKRPKLLNADEGHTTMGCVSKLVPEVKKELAVATMTSDVLILATEGTQQLTSLITDKEARGHSFLMEVKKALSSTEYIEFVGYMQALKSKTMKVVLALKAIDELFSTPERAFLLERFKEFVPIGFRYLCEEHMRRFSFPDKSDKSSS